MLRSLFQCYIRNSLEAVEAYRTAFGAELTSQTLSAEGVNIHTELDLGGQILAISELSGAEPSTGASRSCASGTAAAGARGSTAARIICCPSACGAHTFRARGYRIRARASQ